jgi:hypothetical protein
VKHDLRLWLKANPDSHTANHQESKFKNLLKRKKNSGKLQELNICVRLSRWMHFRSGKSINVDKINVAMLLEGFCELVS